MKKILSIILIFSILIMPVYAHKGRTDGSGGHYNRSTGEYHYHHGYPPHYHTNGICPYDYDDKTNHTSSAGSTSAKSNYSTVDTDKSDLQTEKLKTSFKDIAMAVLGILIAFFPIIGPIIGILYEGIKEKLEDTKKSKSKGKTNKPRK